MKKSNSLINIKKEDIRFLKGALTKGNYIKFLELLIDIDTKSDIEINKRYKDLIKSTLIGQRKRLRKLLKDTTNPIINIHTIISIVGSLQPLLRKFNIVASVNEICTIINVNKEQLLKGEKDYAEEVGIEFDKEAFEEVGINIDMFEHLIFDYGLENKNDNVFYRAYHIAYHMNDILTKVGEMALNLR
ncbi:hypothetical protein KPL37_18280 [Clostridium frigoris]|uniref:Uncharacterized protein n=1 Tax=Clostridium frigoris TaxID=205327 RepID=A0ABS6BYG0_9CLOT|nr:hypothetical protein [Clostridium frigoris]MBU3161648.1 hypothetical protein [Clostridium frigoris]